MPNALRTAREAAEMSLDDVLVAYTDQVPEPLRVSRPTLARLELKDPERFDAGDVFTATALAHIYGARLADLLPELDSIIDDFRRITRRYPQLTVHLPASDRRQQGANFVDLRDARTRRHDRRRQAPFTSEIPLKAVA